MSETPKGAQALHPRQLDAAGRQRLLQLTADIFGDDDQAREKAALELVDLGPVGARAVAKVLQDADLRRHRKGMWALLHTLADMLCLEIPEDLERELVEAVQVLLATLEDNSEYVAWMAADALVTHHLSGGAREGVRDLITEGFRAGLSSAGSVPLQASVYGLVALGDPEAIPDLVEAEERLEAGPVREYLRASIELLRRGEPPERFEA